MVEQHLAPGESDPVWYIAAVDGNREGPLAISTLKSRATSGELLAGQLVWREGFSEWVQASTVEGLFPQRANSSQANPTQQTHSSKNTTRGFLSSPGSFRVAGRLCGVAGAILLLLSTVLFLFGFSWFNGAMLFGIMWMLGEGFASVLENQIEN